MVGCFFMRCLSLLGKGTRHYGFWCAQRFPSAERLAFRVGAICTAVVRLKGCTPVGSNTRRKNARGCTGPGS